MPLHDKTRAQHVPITCVLFCSCHVLQVAARVLDVLLQSDSDAMLPRLGLSVMEALSSQLLELDDFEELITYLKVGR